MLASTKTRNLEKLEKLRSIPGIIKNPAPAREALFWEQANVSIPRGTLNEVSGVNGSGKTESILRLLGKNQGKIGKTAWIEDLFTAYPVSFIQHEIHLDEIFFIESGSESLWTAHQILRSQLFGLVILKFHEWTLEKKDPLVELRRLQLSAEQSQSYVFLLTEVPRQTKFSWPITTQIYLNPKTRIPEVFKEGKFLKKTLLFKQKIWKTLPVLTSTYFNQI